MESNLDYAQLCKYCFQVLERIYLDGKIDQIPFP